MFGGRIQDVLPIGRDDHDHVGLQEGFRPFRAHGSDDHLIDDLGQRGFSNQNLRLELIGDRPECWAREDGLVRHHPQQFESLALEAALRELGDIVEFLGQHFVDDDPDDLNPFLFEEGVVHDRFVDGLADAASGHDDDLGIEQFGDVRVGEVEDAADAGVPGAFAKHEVFLPSHAIKGLVDALDQGLEVGRLQVLAGEVRLDRDGRHVHQRAVQPEDAVHDHGVLVDLLLVDFYKALTHRLDVADPSVALLQCSQESE